MKPEKNPFDDDSGEEPKIEPKIEPKTTTVKQQDKKPTLNPFDD